ncbi:uncharacterized protein TNIN_153381 [Trichonephila inaurata madagascariensis]|uniref:Ig-like domain-containing protein n=1 Tax=Trichonephila inaurata madagascariensis TaxID=2747483 RepID=A0A8X6YYA7_9ARAC|nr:uncharacterized protein TNIN_153381 [Trichonephila inaurata madagascariensis]
MLRETIWFLVLPVVSLGLKITRFEVPSLVVPGDSAILTCFYDLGKEKLYSVKWYKDQVEFFRFFPSLSPQYMAFPAPGLNIDIHGSFTLTVTSENYYSFESLICLSLRHTYETGPKLLKLLLKMEASVLIVP